MSTGPGGARQGQELKSGALQRDRCLNPSITEIRARFVVGCLQPEEMGLSTVNLKRKLEIER
jgi:hypothetical protein